jgi:hypothetical protein
VPQTVVHGVAGLSRTHGKPLSVAVSQSSSRALHDSTGAVHPATPGMPQVAVHVPAPVDPHEVGHVTGAPRMQGNASSVSPSQSSSRALHVSRGGVQSRPVGTSHVAVHVPVPSVPHDAVHVTVVPWMHAQSSSVPPSQSSSVPLHTSTGAAQSAPVGGTQPSVHVPVPVEPHVVVQFTGAPGVHCPASSSSVSVSQSSSTRLTHCSVGGVQASPTGFVHSSVHVPLPVVPHVAVHSV